MANLKKAFNGTVKKEVVAKGSKSERTAVVLHISAAKSYVLRLRGEGGFDTSSLEEYVGKDVSVKGVEILHGHTLVVASKSDITVKKTTRKP